MNPDNPCATCHKRREQDYRCLLCQPKADYDDRRERRWLAIMAGYLIASALLWSAIHALIHWSPS